jgi:hypothetical protein
LLLEKSLGFQWTTGEKKKPQYWFIGDLTETSYHTCNVFFYRGSERHFEETLF